MLGNIRKKGILSHFLNIRLPLLGFEEDTRHQGLVIVAMQRFQNVEQRRGRPGLESRFCEECGRNRAHSAWVNGAMACIPCLFRTRDVAMATVCKSCDNETLHVANSNGETSCTICYGLQHQHLKRLKTYCGKCEAVVLTTPGCDDEHYCVTCFQAVELPRVLDRSIA